MISSVFHFCLSEVDVRCNDILLYIQPCVHVIFIKHIIDYYQQSFFDIFSPGKNQLISVLSKLFYYYNFIVNTMEHDNDFRNKEQWITFPKFFLSS